MTTPRPGRPSPPWFRNGYLWASLLVVACVAAGVAWAASLIYGISTSIDSELDDFASDPGIGYYVDQESVLEATDEPCQRMSDAADAISPLPSTPDRAAAALREVADAGTAITAAIDSADPDPDSEQWRDDWVKVVASLERYADDLESNGDLAEYSAPLTEYEAPVVLRMQDSSDSGCEVPDGVIALDTEYEHLY